MNPQYVGRFVSVTRALAHYGVSEERARQLIDAAGRAPGAEIVLDLAADGDLRPLPVRVVIERMKGHHADVWESPGVQGEPAGREGGAA